MPGTAIWFGRLLILLGAIGYGYGLTAGNASITALIPAAFGVVLMILGHAASARENLRKHLMHAAVIVALIGFFASASRLVMKASEFTVSAGSLSQIAMAVICLVFVVLCVRSFIAARRSET
jgi:Kef-type K+ transport system membrane component KefB